MDIPKLVKALGKQSSAAGTTRQPLVSADNKNGTTRRSQIREVSSRYRSPSPSAPGNPKRCASPNARITSNSTMSVPKRAVSAERKRPSITPSQRSPSPSTPVRDTNAEVLLTPRKTMSSKLTDSLWPSTMRSLSVSFQSDSPIRKRDKTVSHVPSDRASRSSSGVAFKGETPPSGKSTPERRSPLKGKNSAALLENSKPVDSLQTRLVDQHRWPSRKSEKTSTSVNRSDIVVKVNKTSSSPHSRTVTPSRRRLYRDATGKPSQRPSSDFQLQISHLESGKEISCGSSVEDGTLRLQRSCSSSSSDRTSLVNAAARAYTLPTHGSCPSSPLASRGRSPSRARVVAPSSRGTSPARVRPSSPCRQPQNSTSVLSFLADIKKGKKAANNIEDVHHLRLLYNRHLQWRYANARTHAALRSQKAKAEKMLYNIWRIILYLSDCVREKRSNLQQLRLKLKLYSVLVNQVTFLDDWASIEKDTTNSFTWAIQDLQASTLRIPLTQGARGDIKSVKAAVWSAVDVMNATGSSLCSSYSKMEGMNCLVSKLADVAARESAMLNECGSLFGSAAALQVEECSLRTNLLQMKEAWRNDELSIFGY